MERDVRLGYEQRLRDIQSRGEVLDSVASSQPGNSGYLGDDQGYDPATYWSHGPAGHDGSTLSEDEREDWKIVLEDMAGEAERADWRRTLDDTESEGHPSLDSIDRRSTEGRMLRGRV